MAARLNNYQITAPMQNALNARWAENILLSITLIATDLLMVGLGFLLAYYVRFEMGIFLFYQHTVSQIQFYQQLALFLVPFWIIVYWIFGLYNFKNLFSGTKEYALIFNASTFGILVIMITTFIDPQFILARAWVAPSWMMIVACMAAGRLTVRRGVQQLRKSGRFMTGVLVVGNNEEAEAIIRQFKANTRAGIRVVGVVDDTAPVGTELMSGISVLGTIDAIGLIVQQYGVQDIILVSTALRREKLLDIFHRFGVNDHVNVRLSSGLYELMTTGVQVQDVGNVPLLTVNKVRLTGIEVGLKKTLDMVVSTLAILAFLPIMVGIAIAIRLDSPGPIIYRRRVVGVGGRLFDAFKFRTMHRDGDKRLAQYPELVKQLAEEGKLKDDPRVTRIGKLIRSTSLDELPQLFNVFLGQMSLVGPRMITDAERAKYGKWRTNLVTVKPGMTGLWQVSGRSDVGYDQRVMLDMNYIRNYSLWFDLYLLWQTIPAVLKKRGAY